MSRSEQNAELLERLAKVLPNNNTTLADVQAYQAAILIDISKSMAQIADALTDETITLKEEPSNNTTAQWVHSDPHKVKCSKCGCQVSMKAAYNMKYCFECGAKMQTTENNY